MDEKMRISTPVLLIVFNRPACVREVFRAVRAAQPEKLYIFADGPRTDHAEDALLCEQARAETEEIDWTCEVRRFYSDHNLGCGRGPFTGISWVFEQEESAMILEDDCVPNNSFFPFCQELLDRYREDERVLSVSGNNYEIPGTGEGDYYFTHYNNTMGWATWKRVWDLYSYEMKGYDTFIRSGRLGEIVYYRTYADYWKRVFDRVVNGEETTAWDAQFMYLTYVQNGLHIYPKKNLVRYIGFGDDATHTTAADETERIVYGSKHSYEISFPLKHPGEVTEDFRADCILMNDIYKVQTETEMLNQSAGKIKHLTNMDRYLETEGMLLSESLIDLRLKQKKQSGEKVNVLFVCHRPKIWSALKTVYEALSADPLFAVKIVTIPARKFLPDRGFINEYESEGAEDFWKGEDCLAAYDRESGAWLDLRSLQPDYVFFQQSYNIMIPEPYRSWLVSKYAKICYVAYGYEMMRGSVIEGSHPTDFFQNVTWYFAQDKYNQAFTQDYLARKKNTYTRSVLCGYPKFDEIRTIRSIGKKSVFHALWCPRWAEDEGNCNFYDYGKRLASFFDDKEDLQLLFRPHPQMFVNIRAEDSRREDRLADVVQALERSAGCVMDTEDDYLRSFEASDCMVADMTSMMGDYFLTGKPIIYCHKTDCFSEAGRDLAEGFYWVHSFEELTDTIKMLASGEDPMFEKRQEIIRRHYFLPEGGAGKMIADQIRKDALK